MEKLLEYLNDLTPESQSNLCKKCGTTIGYVRRCASIERPVRESVAINFERETGRLVRCEDIWPNTDWEYIRGTSKLAA